MASIRRSKRCVLVARLCSHSTPAKTQEVTLGGQSKHTCSMECAVCVDPTATAVEPATGHRTCKCASGRTNFFVHVMRFPRGVSVHSQGLHVLHKCCWQACSILVEGECACAAWEPGEGGESDASGVPPCWILGLQRFNSGRMKPFWWRYTFWAQNAFWLDFDPPKVERLFLGQNFDAEKANIWSKRLIFAEKANIRRKG